jgi:hypothetical protein
MRQAKKKVATEVRSMLSVDKTGGEGGKGGDNKEVAKRREESKVTLTKAVLCKHGLAVLYPGARVRLTQAR